MDVADSFLILNKHPAFSIFLDFPIKLRVFDQGYLHLNWTLLELSWFLWKFLDFNESIEKSATSNLLPNLENI